MKLLSVIVLTLFLGIFFAAVTVAADDTPQIDPTLELVNALGCKGCHVISGEGGSLATDLTKIGSRMSAQQIKAQLAAETATSAKGFMPCYNSLPDNELEAISEYLYNLP